MVIYFLRLGITLSVVGILYCPMPKQQQQRQAAARENFKIYTFSLILSLGLTNSANLFSPCGVGCWSISRGEIARQSTLDRHDVTDLAGNICDRARARPAKVVSTSKAQKRDQPTKLENPFWRNCIFLLLARRAKQQQQHFGGGKQLSLSLSLNREFKHTKALFLNNWSAYTEHFNYDSAASLSWAARELVESISIQIQSRVSSWNMCVYWRV